MKKILIVDDDAELRLYLAEILKGAGYSVDEAVSGKEAVGKVTSDNFDVVLLDMIMPRGGGSEALNDLKKLAPRSKVIVITAFSTIGNAVDAVKRGASDYISKPFKIDELLTTIRRVIEERRFEDSACHGDLEEILSSLSNPTRTKIMKMIFSRQKMRLMEIAKELGIEDHTKVIFHMRILKQAGLIEQDDERQYCMTPDGVRTIGCLKILEDHLRPSTANRS